METKIINIEKPGEINFIFGQSHFIKTVEDIYETLASSMPDIKFGIAFCEASGDRLIRWDGNDDGMIDLAKTNAASVGCGHTFFVFLKDAYPVNVLDRIKRVEEVCCVYCATANPSQVIVGQTAFGRAVLGVVDGNVPLGFEDDAKKRERSDMLVRFGYKR